MAVSSAWRQVPQRAGSAISNSGGGMSRRQTWLRFVARLLGVLTAAFVVAAPPAAAGESEGGQKLPRFVSLRSDQGNLRVGPGENYPLAWVLPPKEIPPETAKKSKNCPITPA